MFSWSTLVAIAATSQFVAAQTATPDQPPAKPDCVVSDVPANAKPAPATIALDLRKAIFIDLQQAVARAQRQAAAAYPSAEGGAPLSPGNVQKDSRLAGKRDGMALALERTYLVDILKARSLTCAAAREIAREGRDSKWPAMKP